MTKSLPSAHPRGAWVRCIAVVMAVAVCAAPRWASAEYGNSLDWVPADVSVYSSSLKIKEQIDLVAESNAWKRFKEIPTVKMVWQMAEMQINNPVGPAAMFWQLMELPENKQLAALLGEMFSEEIAFYAGADFVKLMELGQIIQGSRVAPALEAIEDGDSGDLDSNEARVRMIAEAIVEDPALLDVPQMVFAFRIKDKDAAETQLKRLEVVANMLLKQSPIDAKLEREEIGDTEFLVLELDGSMIPWPEETPSGLPFDEDTYESLKEIVSEKELAVALGQWGDYVVLSFGQDADHLDELGSGDLLADSDEFEYLKEHFEENLVSVTYVSNDVMQKQALTPQDLDDWATFIDEAVQSSDEVPEGLKERLSDDLPEMADDLKPYLPEAGAMASCSLLTDTGFEAFTYNWAPQPRLDATKPLEMLQHVGGSPIIAIIARGTHNPDDYDIVAKWCSKALTYVEDFAFEQMGEEEREKAAKALEIARPLLKRLNETTRERLVPALADSQSALVIDADITSKQWHEDMPESFSPLPMAELAVVMGVSDVEEFMTAMREYRDIADDAVEAIREENPEAIPADYEIPDAEEKKTSDGTVYSWKFGEAGLDEQITLCGAVGEHVAAFATSADLAERVLAHNSLKTPEGLSDGDEPKAVVAGIDFAALVEAVEPWVEYAIRSTHAGEDAVAEDPADDPEDLRELCEQVRSGMEILKCFRGVWGETREEDGVWVTHTVGVFEDLED